LDTKPGCLRHSETTSGKVTLPAPSWGGGDGPAFGDQRGKMAVRLVALPVEGIALSALIPRSLFRFDASEKAVADVVK
jgi:hypothetical protein